MPHENLLQILRDKYEISEEDVRSLVGCINRAVDEIIMTVKKAKAEGRSEELEMTYPKELIMRDLNYFQELRDRLTAYLKDTFDNESKKEAAEDRRRRLEHRGESIENCLYCEQIL